MGHSTTTNTANIFIITTSLSLLKRFKHNRTSMNEIERYTNKQNKALSALLKPVFSRDTVSLTSSCLHTGSGRYQNPREDRERAS